MVSAPSWGRRAALAGVLFLWLWSAAAAQTLLLTNQVLENGAVVAEDLAIPAASYKNRSTALVAEGPGVFWARSNTLLLVRAELAGSNGRVIFRGRTFIGDTWIFLSGGEGSFQVLADGAPPRSYEVRLAAEPPRIILRLAGPGRLEGNSVWTAPGGRLQIDAVPSGPRLDTLMADCGSAHLEGPGAIELLGERLSVEAVDLAGLRTRREYKVVPLKTPPTVEVWLVPTNHESNTLARTSGDNTTEEADTASPVDAETNTIPRAAKVHADAAPSPDIPKALELRIQGTWVDLAPSSRLHLVARDRADVAPVLLWAWSSGNAFQKADKETWIDFDAVPPQATLYFYAANAAGLMGPLQILRVQKLTAPRPSSRQLIAPR